MIQPSQGLVVISTEPFVLLANGAEVAQGPT
jgi:hypothetical protein